MTSKNISLPHAEDLLKTLAQKVQPLLQANTALVGIQSGGVWLMQKLLVLLEKDIAANAIEHGTLDVSFYRDDYEKRGLKAENRPSQIPFDVENKHIILIDDVFYTGRTTRAAMNELFDYGRPASITLVALVNRGGRELPIAPQITAADIALDASQNLQLIQNQDGTLSLELQSLNFNQSQVHKHE
ncbi:bifunctional pyr operon transcriptional regulator/uracil phosphoribosyltransferase PyrR [Methylotenera versatilis]|jgi:pyrimidine operon attenuation protein / uracil phosphoribosyltransferase|uniref:Uracil phosphoribosyltransferase n=1 Tax=Methylotenera versatilis (strain 301) TaxID=666681 RepID=D7DNL9_METV0|nr:bifunctional pyr operon transcriptional regulator/uracil phosphoribosyltransferase PyrR [Methylotenera versatilis]ADI29036.1 Uracil phosphoribosyltransferase [Methylotenera versatilis 301]